MTKWTEEIIRERLWHYLAGEGFGPRWAQRVVRGEQQSTGDAADIRMMNAAVKLAIEIAEGPPAATLGEMVERASLQPVK